MTTHGRILAALIAASGKKPNEVAKQAGVSQSFLSLMIHGKRPVSELSWNFFMAVLRCDLPYYHSTDEIGYAIANVVALHPFPSKEPAKDGDTQDPTERS